MDFISYYSKWYMKFKYNYYESVWSYTVPACKACCVGRQN